MSNYKILPSLESLRSKMVLTAIEIRELKDVDVHCHAEQLEGAAEMVQDWIENIRDGK